MDGFSDCREVVHMWFGWVAEFFSRNVALQMSGVQRQASEYDETSLWGWLVERNDKVSSFLQSDRDSTLLFYFEQ